MAIKKLWLNTLENSRRTLARLIRAYHSDPTADSQKFRTEVYALRTMVDFFKLENDQQIAERIEAIEAILDNPQKIRQLREVK